MAYRLLVKNAAQIVRVCANGERYLCGDLMDSLDVLEDASLVVGQDGKIVAVGPSVDILQEFKDATFDATYDACGKSIIPGLVDGHTHPVWAGDRVHEFSMKLSGASYMDIHAKGGGIHFTVRHTTEESEENLLASLHDRMKKAIKHGTTLLEAKSGYGLALETEVKMLRVLHNAVPAPQGSIIPDIISTYLAAHAVPKGSTSREATDDIVNRQIPAIQKLKQEGKISPTNIDVFLEKGVFDKEETREILQAGEATGLLMNFHGDEINPMESGELAGELGALAVSHLERVTTEGMIAMAKKPTFATLLPTTAYLLRLEVPPAREMIKHGVPIALGSDFNPNAHCISMPFVMNLACITLKMTMNEALVASTINAAGSLGQSDMHGSLEVGKWANLVVVDAPNWEHIIYQLGDPPIAQVIKKGELVKNC